MVEALRSDWSVDPFTLLEKDGFFYGRGVTDMKGDDALVISAFLRMKHEGFRPSRDLILALTADEENGPSNGVQFLVKDHRDLVDAAFAINFDMGGGDIKNGKHLYDVDGSKRRKSTRASGAGSHESGRAQLTAH